MEILNNTEQEKIIKSMISFIANIEDVKSMSNIDLYNSWSAYSGIIIEDDELMEYCLKYICEAKDINNELLKENITSM